MTDIIPRLSAETGIPEQYIRNIALLLDEGNTIPFIARYRKESHGSMDDQALRELADRMVALRNLEKRREDVRAAILAQGKLTDEVAAALDAAQTLSEVEDVYRPFKPKRRTRATIAREKGLEPLAEVIFAQELRQGDVYELAIPYIDAE